MNSRCSQRNTFAASLYLVRDFIKIMNKAQRKYAMRTKEKVILAIPIALFINFAIVIHYAKIQIEDLFDGAPLPGLTELLFSIPFLIWLIIACVFSFAKLKLDQNEQKKKLRMLWWAILISSPFIIALALACPFGHELSHYFTGTCNWGGI